MKEMKAKLQLKLKGAAPAATAVCLMVAAMMMAGCQTADPASRSNDASYGDLEPRVSINGSSNYVNVAITIGDGVLASADGGGDTQSNTPTQTTDVPAQVAVGVGGGSAATGGGSPTAGLTDKLMAALKSTGLVTENNTAAVKAAVDAACTDGNCAPK